ncbi:MAG: eukaryotic-like serine/threonine-protein kinase [Thermosediminibacterales bacterium]|nr:eukaryotic-like serine/threonine-protein kinase [Thermosediminibacterales bacterium]MDK2835434.1 eukaryotic-like serine/threonine-protein kinase [Thermosediminibacterales bacterium]
MVGKILGNRYEILEKIGGGGMALVYKARCTLLNRIVAVKVLQPQFANDEEFIKRFRREAQAAASLSHPNIVSIYDVGREGQMDYIVMEYVNGITLKKLIEDKAPFASDKIIHIGLQICAALEHAHKNYIIHRDIKPHNILITEEGNIKVTDFGLARAVTSSTLTYSGNVIGSVHYFSPEQARGGFIGERSDLYSLGVVLYEMATGHVPFEGESPISVALKHINEDVTRPSKLNPYISSGLEQIILKLLEKDQNYRYKSARELCDDLRKVLKNPEKDIVIKKNKDYETKVLPNISEKIRENEQGGAVMAQAPKKKVKKKKGGLIRFLVWLFTISILAGGMTWGYFWVKDYLTVPIVQVPNVIGKTEEEAEKEFSKVGLKYDVVERIFDELPAGRVVDQSPKGGENVKIDRPPISIWVSKGPQQVTVPNLIGKDEREAEILLDTYELKKGKVERRYSEEFPEGIVIEQNPRADITVREGTEINYVVSMGKEPLKFILPDFRGQNLDDVKQILADMGLILGEVSYQTSNQFVKGIVLGQLPAPKTEVEEGSQINFVVSEGPGPEREKQVLFKFKLPTSPEKFNVKVVVYDSTGHKVVYNKYHRPEDSPLEVPVKGVGEMRIVVLIDDEIWGEKIY